MLIYGFHPVRETLRHRPEDVNRVFVAVRGGARREEIIRLCSSLDISLDFLSAAELRKRVDGVHNGFAAEVERRSTPVAGGDPKLVVLLEDVQDPRNLGALLRVCEGAGVGRVLIRDRGSSPLSPTVRKTSAGASEWLAIDRITNSANAIRALKEKGYWVYGADAAGVAAWDLDLSGPVVLCLGGEARGLRRRTRELCDGLVSVPMRGRVESLNVATAAAALLYEAVRQRQMQGP
jgi:23S rRNA (guanosine2251-2'-O)-methyltransferase